MHSEHQLRDLSRVVRMVSAEERSKQIKDMRRKKEARKEEPKQATFQAFKCSYRRFRQQMIVML